MQSKRVFLKRLFRFHYQLNKRTFYWQLQTASRHFQYKIYKINDHWVTGRVCCEINEWKGKWMVFARLFHLICVQQFSTDTAVIFQCYQTRLFALCQHPLQFQHQPVSGREHNCSLGIFVRTRIIQTDHDGTLFLGVRWSNNNRSVVYISSRGWIGLTINFASRIFQIVQFFAASISNERRNS